MQTEQVQVANNLGSGASGTAVSVTGGVYVLSVSGSPSATDALNIADNQGTACAVGVTISTTAKLYGPIYLPPGKVQYVSGTGTGVFAYLTRIPT